MINKLFAILLLLAACSPKSETEFDFENETGLSEDEFYRFLNTTYSKKLDTLGGSKTLFLYAGAPIKIEFENGAPTEHEPPTMDFLRAPYKLDSSRLRGFKLIQKNIYSRIRQSVPVDGCEFFQKEIGEYMCFIYLPWLNTKDSTIIFKDVKTVCPPTYHQGQGVLYRLKKNDGDWELVN